MGINPQAGAQYFWPMRWNVAQWFEVRWWKNYLNDKPAQDYIDWKRAYWNGFLEKIELVLPPHSRILDAGCGPAGIFIALEEHQVTAVDPLLSAYSNFPHHDSSRHPNVTFKEQRIEDLSGSSYDLVFCLNVINHVESLSASLDRLTESVAEDGVFVLSIDCHNTGFFKALFRFLPFDILHPHQYDQAEYESMLEERGFKILRSVCIKPGNLFDYVAVVAKKS